MSEDVRGVPQLAKEFSEQLKINEDDWPQLHSWASDFREKHNLTCAAFLRDICELQPSSSYQQLLSKNGISRLVSTRTGSLGNALREALRKAKTLKHNVTSEVILGEQLTDCWMDYAQELKGKGVLSITIKSSDDSDSMVIAEVDIRLRSTVTKDDIVHFFKSHVNNVECKIEVEFITVELLGAPMEISPNPQ